MEVLVSTAAASARAATPLSFAPLHRRPPPFVAVRVPTRSWRCRCARPVSSDPAPSEEPASASTVVVTDKPAAGAGEEESAEAGAVSGGSGGAVEAAVVAAPVPPEAPEEDGGVDDILSKLDIEVTPTYVLFGTGAFIALLILSRVISAIDSVPLLPKVLELVGTGYSVWFTARYLLFKENRDELFAKFEDLKERII